jgi:hypothetical protein
MSKYHFERLVRYEECNEPPNQYALDHLTAWLALVLSTLRLLIVVVGLVLVVVALVAAGAADQVVEVLRQWPFIP